MGEIMRLLVAVVIGATALAPSLTADPVTFPDTRLAASYCSHFGGEGFPSGRLGHLMQRRLGYWPEALPSVRLKGFGTGGFPITAISSSDPMAIETAISTGGL